MDLDQIIDWLGASAGLGTAAFGLVEAVKGTPLGVLGAGKVEKRLGPELVTALTQVYGNDVPLLIRDTFRRGAPALADFLKNGLRVALTTSSAATLATVVQQNPVELEKAVRVLQQEVEAETADAAAAVRAPATEILADRAVLGRFELAIDARVDAAVSAAQEAFASYMRLLAMGFAVTAGTLVGALSDQTSPLEGLLVGILATPLAPIAKDVVAVLEAARTALIRRDGV